ncbi:kynurenine formamidase-like isoform X2 [Manduca sexta]|uniref:Kynurenine formamidase n=1 Tax=Manduca sexta TaxID=7130 RepID=A0A921YL98_MANSE|nr:kynurenine formamidase-like isoform X2 [Manduca sexta]KAG6441391.1 hypothetical protein O3G_MSEX001747 [Manduca sexta]
MAVTIVVFAFLASTISTLAEKVTLNDVLFSGGYEFIDLTHPYDNNTVYWPGHQKFTFTKKIENIQEDKSWYAAKEFSAAEHGGTHLDAPYHFLQTGDYVGDIPLEKLIVPLIIVDVSSIANDDANFVLYKHHLDYLLNYNSGQPCILIFKFGWSKYFHDRNKYLGIGIDQKSLNFPGLSVEVAQWITTSYKNVVGIGVDVASVDPGSVKELAVHKILSRAGLYNMENVKLDRAIPDHGCTALVMPMKIAAGTGAPLRLVAICPKPKPDNF